MKKKNFKTLALALVLIFTMLSLSSSQSNFIRGSIVASLSPCWNCFHKLSNFSLFHRESPLNHEQQVEFERLTVENKLLRMELDQLNQTLGTDIEALSIRDRDLIPARIIFRSPASWENSFWINVGSETNRQLGKEIVKKNSPVLVGHSVIGVVDYVGKRQTRVKLITDPGLSPAVRAVRQQGKTVHYLAKGELRGSIKPLWRTDQSLLHGIGFNYDFSDEKGSARDLRTGKPADKDKIAAMPIVRVGDLLVTSGLDGVFPEGLPVANVTKIYPLKEGDYYFELEAKPTVENLNDLPLVFVLQPVDFDPQDIP